MIVRRDAVELLIFNDLRIRDYTAGRDVSSSLATITVPPGVRHPEAWSRCSDKYYYVLAGQLRFGLDDEEHDLMAGDLGLVYQGRRFWYENQTSEPATLLLVHTPSFNLESEVFVETR
jgi:mannose-6-phosphate isomerase-like protein (cupin superfamily)